MQWVCLLGILFCHSQYAYLQETLLGDKSLKLNVALVLCFQYAIAAFVSMVIIVASGESLFQAFTYDDLTVSIFNFCSMNFSNRAMTMVSYPFVILCKSAKIIPVILVGTLRGVYQPTKVQFGISIMITVGLILFNFAKVSF